MKAVVTDFDGTITKRDVAELLLQEFTGDAWRAIEALHPKIGTRETLARQFALVRATRDQLVATAEKLAELDPAFPPFVEFCRQHTVPLEIVSEGLDAYLLPLLRRWGLDVPYRTNGATFYGEEIALTFPYADATCTLCGTCKMGRVLQLRARGFTVAYVGNGISDLCPALEADLVFAKDDLARLCREHGRDHIVFRDFADVQRGLAEWR
ncbi:MAG TPA: MtnX-like HAD-IB family phosphatase [Candidatus Thermoplasmatota archaeon]|nr:MtnX-like HAD-IB family phosphatase [Candidatus Thermoplasmatota archaeon]